MARIEGKSFADYIKYRHSQGIKHFPKTHALYCKHCKIYHPYNGRNRLDISFDRRKTGYVILWMCPVSGDVIGEGMPEPKETIKPIEEEEPINPNDAPIHT